MTLRFASSEEALQHLADLTGKQVKVAVDLNEKTKKIVNHFVEPVIKKELSGFDYQRDSNSASFKKNIGSQVFELFKRHGRLDDLARARIVKDYDLKKSSDSVKTYLKRYHKYYHEYNDTLSVLASLIVRFGDEEVTLTAMISPMSKFKFSPEPLMSNDFWKQKSVLIRDPDMKNKILKFVEEFKKAVSSYTDDISTWSELLRD